MQKTAMLIGWQYRIQTPKLCNPYRVVCKLCHTGGVRNHYELMGVFETIDASKMGFMRNTMKLERRN